MAQRRNSSGRGDERSDLDDTKALAAKARSTTGGPIVAPNPAELSGVRPRRDSVIGARLTPPPRQTSSELPNWFFGALGFLTVLLVGFAGLFVLGRSGKLDSLLGEAAPTVATAPSPAPAAPAAEPAPAPAAEPSPPPAAEKAAGRAAHHAAEPAPADEPPPAKAPAAEKAAEKEPAPPPEEPPAHGSKPASREHVAAAPKSHGSKPADPGTAEPGEGESEEPPAAAPAPKAVKPAAAPKPEAEESDDDQSAPGQDAVEAALDALSTKVRGCFVKYQIKGTARVRLVATPGGSAESVNVTGDFEDTPTGMCVEGVVSSAKLPTFKGPPLKLSQSYQLR